MEDLRAIRYVTDNYQDLQGLRLVPLGVPFLAYAAWRLDWLPWAPRDLAVPWIVGSFVVALLISVVLGRHYQRHFGSVHRLPSRFRMPLALVVVLAFLILYGLRHELA